MEEYFFIVIGIFFIFIVLSILYTEYDRKSYSEEPQHSNSIKVRCPPNSIKIRCPPNDIGTILNEKNSQIKNKGYINELIYKPNTQYQVEFNNYLLDGQEPAMPLNENYDKMSKDLPIGNINVEYLTRYKTSYI